MAQGSLTPTRESSVAAYHGIRPRHNNTHCVWLLIDVLKQRMQPRMSKNKPSRTGITTKAQKITGDVFCNSWLSVGPHKSSSTGMDRPNKIDTTPDKHKIIPRIFFMVCASGLTDNRRLDLEPILFHENDLIPALAVCPQRFGP